MPLHKRCPPQTQRVLKKCREDPQQFLDQRKTADILTPLQWALRSCLWNDARYLMHYGRFYYADLEPQDMAAIEFLRLND